MQISSPNWMSEEAASQEDPEDDGDTIEAATDLPLSPNPPIHTGGRREDSGRV